MEKRIVRWLAIAGLSLVGGACEQRGTPDSGPAGRDASGARGDASGLVADASGLSADASRFGFDAGRSTLGPDDPGSDACASVELETERVIPTVWLVVDGSGSMASPLAGLGTPSRWQLLRDALIGGAGGLVGRLESSVAFGLYIYDGGLSVPGGPAIPGVCPRLVQVEPALDNASAITAVYPDVQLGAGTPTHYALESLEQHITEVGPSPRGPTYVVLATDGKPSICDFHDGVPSTPDTERVAVETVQQMAAAGIRVFVISLAGDAADAPQVRTHLAALAAAGGTGTEPFTPTSTDDLVLTLNSIIGAAAPCDVRIQGEISPGSECRGAVRLSGAELGCNDPNGYRVLPDRQTLQLQGQACSTLQSEPHALLQAEFPCDEILF